jgi:hypothetical protein
MMVRTEATPLRTLPKKSREKSQFFESRAWQRICKGCYSYIPLDVNVNHIVPLVELQLAGEREQHDSGVVDW